MIVKHWVGCLGLVLASLCAGLRAESGLNGVAVYSELGNELFMAALYSGQTGTNAQELINGSYPKRIELKILSAQGMTERQFSRLWRESVAINNARDLLISQADNMVYFEGLIRDRLELNDHLVISYAPAEGVAVSLNTVELGHLDDEAFFGLLLRAWIGQVPSSTRFRDDLLNVNQADAASVNRFNHMYPRTARIDVVKSWRQLSIPAEAAVASAAVIALEPQADPKADQKIDPKAGQQIEQQIEQQADPKPLAPLTAANMLDAEKSVEAPVIAAVTQPQLPGNRPIAMAPVEQGLDHAQELLAKQFYMADVFKKIYSQVSYPKRAQELQQMGTVRLSVVIDAVGNVIEVISIEPTRFLLLNNAALAAVKKAAPFSPLPDGLDLAKLEVSVPITFSLEGL